MRVVARAAQRDGGGSGSGLHEVFADVPGYAILEGHLVALKAAAVLRAGDDRADGAAGDAREVVRLILGVGEGVVRVDAGGRLDRGVGRVFRVGRGAGGGDDVIVECGGVPVEDVHVDVA